MRFFQGNYVLKLFDVSCIYIILKTFSIGGTLTKWHKEKKTFFNLLRTPSNELSPTIRHLGKTCYIHFQQLNFRLKQLKRPIDIMMSHDWPNGVVNYGDKEKLLKIKRHFQSRCCVLSFSR